MTMASKFMGSGPDSRLLFERMPALELLRQQSLDLRGARLVGPKRFGGLLVVGWVAHPRGERLLLGFEGLDLGRQGFELAAFLVRELDAAGNPPLARRSRPPCHRVGGGTGALAEVIGVAAGIFLPGAVSFGGEGLGHYVVEEGPVVRDEEDGPG